MIMIMTIIIILILIIIILIIIMTISFLTSIVSRPGLDVGKLYAAHSEEYSTDGSIEFP